MSLYGTYLAEAYETYIDEAAWNVKKSEDEYINKISKDKSKIEKEVNRISKLAYEEFKNKKFKTDYYNEDRDMFCSFDYPKVKSFNKDTDYICINLDYTKHKKAGNDMCLFYEDFLVKKLNSECKLEYKFFNEDYLGIYIK